MEITINLAAPELAAAINNLAASLAGNKPAAAPAAPRSTAKKADAPKSDPVEEKQPDPIPDPLLAEEQPKEELIVYTLVQVREKLAALSQAGKQVEVKALITKLGATKLSEIPEAKYAELMKEAEAL